MRLQSLYRFTLVFLLCHNFISSTPQTTPQLSFIGIYSICMNKTLKNELNENALMFHHTAQKILTMKTCLYHDICAYESTEEFVSPTYVYHDVCENFHHLIDTSIDIYLSKTMRVSSKIIFVYTSNEFASFVAGMFN